MCKYLSKHLTKFVRLLNFHHIMLVLPVLQGKDRDLPQVCGRKFLFLIRAPRLTFAGTQQTQKEYAPAFSERPPNLGCPIELLPEFLLRSAMCYPSQALSEDDYELLCGG